MPDPSPSELARDLAQLEARVTRERQELLTELRQGFADVRRAIEQQSENRISRDVYEADQRRLDHEMGNLRDEIGKIRKLVIVSPVAVIATAIALSSLLN
jgi:exonuclease VII large subunit